MYQGGKAATLSWVCGAGEVIKARRDLTTVKEL